MGRRPVKPASEGRRTIGIDIGGANLKYVCTDGNAASYPFAMWNRSSELTSSLVDHLSQFLPASSWAVTMTGELADCFLDRKTGVEFIVDAVCEAARRIGSQPSFAPEIRFYGVDGRFHRADDAKRLFEVVAASNWHALASQVAKTIAGDATLVDIGSTTTDIIPLRKGRVATSSMTDFQRLVGQSLVYIGCRRTPVCALVDRLWFNGASSRIMNEWFATIDDARIVLGIEPEHPDDCESADGAPRTVARSANRIARMIGLDQTFVSVEQAAKLAVQIMDSAKREIHSAFDAIDQPRGPIVISGHGRDLFDVPEDREVIDLSTELGGEISRCAPSWAVANLWADRSKAALVRKGRPSCDVS
ncbi:hydantoinase/oxoprolinase family protein [Rubripirellula reticaptiva]|uniref:Hydantoinase/oxoprolinase n=1 Tax=Rubripirellula reticaptiva TaxID=2528013 RepID=A0A5C6F5L1_9BACT|nr:hydantoinase/oxoprolinase family protein [Rubripirellula reticaptiva]TWU55376.1 Hydantoinase/oxoprolinase [Rubripirellula reticaptiva]